MHPRPWRVALLSTAAALAWQWLVVEGYFQGHWSALFLAGGRLEQSPAVRGESTYVMPRSYGFDGQFYHAIAHDPLDLQKTDRFLDFARLRYLRILLPGLSYLFGFGRPFGIDRAYRALLLLSLFLGVFSFAAFAVREGRSGWWGAAFLALPATFMSLERELTDLPLCALMAAALLAAERGRRSLAWLALAGAALDREMGVVAVAAFTAAAIQNRRRGEAVVWGLAALPALVWAVWVWVAIPGLGHFDYPLSSIIFAFEHPPRYAYPHGQVALLRILDAITIGGTLFSFGLGFWSWRRRKDTLGWLALALAGFGVAVSGNLDYRDAYSFTRVNSPLFLVQGLQSLRTGNRTLLWPLASVLPRSLIPGASMTLRSLRYLLLG